MYRFDRPPSCKKSFLAELLLRKIGNASEDEFGGSL